MPTLYSTSQYSLPRSIQHHYLRLCTTISHTITSEGMNFDRDISRSDLWVMTGVDDNVELIRQELLGKGQSTETWLVGKPTVDEYVRHMSVTKYFCFV